MIPRPSTQSARGGYALMAVLGVLALLVVYIATVWGAVGFTIQNSKRFADSQTRAQIAALAVEQALAMEPTTGTQTFQFAGPTPLHVTVETVDASHAVWQRLYGVNWRPGDRLVSLEWDEAVPLAQRQCLVNPSRAGVIVIPKAAATAGAAPPSPRATPEAAVEPSPAGALPPQTDTSTTATTTTVG